MKQLDVDVSPPTFAWNPYLTSANVTFAHVSFDLGIGDLSLPGRLLNAPGC